MDKKSLGIAVAILIAGALYSGVMGYRAGYNKAVADVKATQEALGEKASQDAADAANPFKVVNPLEGVEANPFEETAKKLNPFSTK